MHLKGVGKASTREMEKKKNQNNNKIKRSVRTPSRDNRSREENGRKMSNGKETHAKAHAKPASDSVISNTNAGSESSEVYENVVVHYVDDAYRSEDASKGPDSQSVEDNVDDLEDHSSDLSGEIQQVKGEDSDFESAKDSASSQGDPQTGDDNEKIETISGDRKENAKKGSSELSSRKSRAEQDNEKSKPNGKPSQSTARKPLKSSKSKVITKDPSNDNKHIDLKVHPASESSEGVDDKSFEEVDLERPPEATNGAKSSENGGEITCAEDDTAKQQEKAALKEKIEIMESRIEKMEEELREVAALEISLYSVIPEHGSSAHKVHTPARRLSRLYMHACKNWAPSRRATTARSTVSGLILVARTCGNDVARLTFWLSNTVVLREIISQAFGVSRQLSPTGFTKLDVNGKFIKGNAFPFSGSTQVNKTIQLFKDWQETSTFTTALEKVEAWIFSRVVESVWWQALTPNMLTPVEDLISQKSIGRLLGPSLGDQQQGNFSIELWKNAFQAAFQRLCPVRAAGHECGCLPVLARMVMEQCFARLDVAMFNAILRESAHQIPTDPVSDPIVDSRVLPIPAGDLSFGSGAQLKNTVGNWSMWFTESLGKESSHLLEDHRSEIKDDEEQTTHAKTKCFRLLNELSELLMLPKDMLMDPSIRKEICPSIGLAVIIRILCNFTPDEFCPDAVPPEVLEALNTESFVERRLAGDSSGEFPYAAEAVVYFRPSSEDVSEKVAEAGEKTQLERNASMIQKKGYTSDEELVDLDSPLTSIIEPASPNKLINGHHTMNSKDQRICRGNSRYELLREVWSS